MKEGDYHDAMNADNFMAWVEQQFIPAWKAKYKNQPCILVLDGAPYYLYGMTNPFTMSKTACAQLMLEVIGVGTMFEFWRGGDLYECGVPGEGEEFANAPAGLSKEETQCAMYNTLQEHSPAGYLESWIEWRFRQLGWTVIFTPPYACLFQCLELVWADAKDDLARKYFKGRTMQWIKETLTARLKKIKRRKLVRHAEMCMNIWIEQDSILSGTIDLLIVSQTVRTELLKHNAKFLSEEELDDYLNDANINVHVDIDEDNEIVS